MGSDSRPILLATRSRGKAGEILQILRAASDAFRLLTLDDARIPPGPDEEAIEAFDTFTANADAKARFFADRSGLPTLADDSGLRVDALGGRPGVLSRRFSGRTDLDGPDLDRANNEALLEAIRESGSADCGAHFICAAALATPGGPTLVAIASSGGAILDRPRGYHGFGYDPLFLVPRLGLTFAELDDAAKHALSHRGRAFRALATMLRDTPPRDPRHAP